MSESIIGDIKLPKVNKLNPGESMSFQIPKSKLEVDTGSVLFVVDPGEYEGVVSYNEENFLNIFSIKRNNEWFIKCIIQTTSYGIVVLSIDEDDSHLVEGNYYFFNNDNVNKMTFKFHFKGSIFDGMYFYDYMCYNGEVIENAYNEDYTKLESVTMYSTTNDFDKCSLPVDSYEFDMIPSIHLKKKEGVIEFIPNTSGDILVHVKSTKGKDDKFRQEYLITKRG